VEVPAEETKEGAGQGKAEDRHQGLVHGGGQADEPQGNGGDEGDPRGQAVQAVDEVHAVDHPDDPEKGEGDSHGVAEDDDPAQGVLEGLDADPEGHGPAGNDELAEELPAGPQLQGIIQQAEEGGDH
jgi:hypothetical protein